METKRPAPRPGIWERGLWYLPAALPVGIGILCALLLFFSLLQLLGDTAEWMLLVMAVIALFFSAYGMGRFAAFHRRRYGLKTGLCCGLTLYLLLSLISLIWLKDGGGWLRLFSLLLGGAWGGVSGANARHRRPPR